MSKYKLLVGVISGVGLCLFVAATTGPLSVTGTGHIQGFGGTPAITTHFNTSSDSIAGTDVAGMVTAGNGSATSTGTITFSTAWANAPSCVAIEDADTHLIETHATTTTLQLTEFNSVNGNPSNFTSGDVVKYVCIGY